MTTLITPTEEAGVAPPEPAAIKARKKRREFSVRVALIICFGFVIVGSLYPTISVLSVGLSGDALPRYADFISNPIQLRTLRNTIVLGLLVGSIGTLLGFLFAFVQTRLDVPFK